jgi:hypothetical protein
MMRDGYAAAFLLNEPQPGLRTADHERDLRMRACSPAPRALHLLRGVEPGHPGVDDFSETGPRSLQSL